MLKLIFGATGHGKINHTLNETIKNSDGKRILFITYELRIEQVVSRISKILNFYNHVSPSEIKIVSGIRLGEMSICKEYDVVAILSYMPPASDKFSHQIAMDSFILILNGMNDISPDKLIMATIQTAGGIGRKLSDVKEKFFSSTVKTSDNFDHIHIFRDSETDKFNVMSLHNKTVEAFSKSDFFLD